MKKKLNKNSHLMQKNTRTEAIEKESTKDLFW